jgi:hypothetical protein
MLYPIFCDITIDIISNNIPEDAQRNVQLIDSLPIVTCKGKNRSAKVALDCVDKGFCSTKNMYYYGLKLHLLAFRRKGTLPFPNKTFFSAASENDLAIVKQLNWLDELTDTQIFADKIYADKKYFKKRQQEIQLDIFTPVKIVKNTLECLVQRDFGSPVKPCVLKNKSAFCFVKKY